MTIALTIKINDGLVIASDSATTMIHGDQITNIYDNANKVFNLFKGLPVGAVTWGAGNIGKSSIAAIVKNFRKGLSEGENALDTKDYTIQNIVERFHNFLIDLDVLSPVVNSSLGFYIGGYSSKRDFPETWTLSYNKSETEGPQILKSEDQTGSIWNGQPEALNRLIWGFNPFILPNILESVGIEQPKIDEIMRICWGVFPAQIFTPSMPLQDAIELAEFMVQTTIKYIKYTPGHQTVGGPIEIAAITRHEGFKWIKRKHFYSPEINPKEV